MIGRSFRQDLPWPVLDPLTRFGADLQYEERARAPYALTPWARPPYWMTLSASNKPSEHNIQNYLPVVNPAQLRGQTHPPNLKTLISHRIQLGPGNQSLGGT